MYLCTHEILRGGAEVACWAHNPKVVGSNPAPATNKKRLSFSDSLFFNKYTLFSTSYNIKSSVVEQSDDG